jgi:hypothetical protein
MTENPPQPRANAIVHGHKPTTAAIAPADRGTVMRLPRSRLLVPSRHGDRVRSTARVPGIP